MEKTPSPLVTAAKRFASVGPSFGLLGLLVAYASSSHLGRVSESAGKAVEEMLALNALALIAIAAMFFTGLVSALFGRPEETWGAGRRRIVYYFSTRPAEFVADFAAPMFWFFSGAATAMLIAGALTVRQAMVFALFLASLVVIGFVTMLYVNVLHSPELRSGWRWIRSGHLVGFMLLAGAIWLAYLLPVVPAAGR